MSKTDSNNLSQARLQSSQGVATATPRRRADESAATRRQSIKHLDSVDFCRPRS